MRIIAAWSMLFLSTPSARRATRRPLRLGCLGRYFYPRPPRGGRQIAFRHLVFPFGISIHALREEGDTTTLPICQEVFDFYPRPPRGGRQICFNGCISSQRFLSTPSARRATITFRYFIFAFGISIHALREEGDIFGPFDAPKTCDISIHALREEGDVKTCQISTYTTKFLSTPSARRATAKTETKSLFSNKLYNILHEFRRALIYNGSKNDPNHAK